MQFLYLWSHRERCYARWKKPGKLLGLVQIIFLVNGPSRVSAEIEIWDCRSVCKVMP